MRVLFAGNNFTLIHKCVFYPIKPEGDFLVLAKRLKTYGNVRNEFTGFTKNDNR